MTNDLLMITLIATIIMQWGLFLILFLATIREQTGLHGIGFNRSHRIYLGWGIVIHTPRRIDFAWGLSFLLAANLILAGLAWGLEQVGLPMPGEIALLIPQDTVGRVVWVFVSITAGVCEETMFRGYLMTRLRILGKTQSWIIPTAISALAFGICHSYQGIPGMIVLTVYGVLFSLLYIRTGSIWPGIIAHFFQDFLALFIPQ